MRVLVTGDRHYQDELIIGLILEGCWEMAYLIGDELTVIEGVCPYGGADKIAADWAQSPLNSSIHQPYPADWKCFGKAAGPIRNRQMVDIGQPDVVFAFHDDLENSKGTKDCAEYAASKGIPVYHIRRLA